MGRFDGILLINHLLSHHPNYKISPLIRNCELYQIKVEYSPRHSFIIRDSYKLFTASRLKSLGKDLCPELGDKGSVDHSNIRIDNLLDNKAAHFVPI